LDLKGTISNAENAVPRIEKLLQLIETGTSTNEDSLDTLFGAVYGMHFFELNMTSFETLRQKG